MTQSKAQRAAAAAAKAAKVTAPNIKGAAAEKPAPTPKANDVAQTAAETGKPVQVPVGSKGKAGGRVTVACKLPHGLLLRVFRMIEQHEPVMGGGTRTSKVAQQMGEAVRINGCRVPHGETAPFIIAGGYALTPNVDSDLFDLWIEQNKDADAVKNNLIYAHARQDGAQDWAREHKATRSGLEPINPDKRAKDPRMVKGIKPGNRNTAGDDAEDAA